MQPIYRAIKRVIHGLPAALTRTLGRVARERGAATAVEYGLIIACVVMAMLIGFTLVANLTTGIWNTVDTSVSTVSPES